MRMSMDIFGTEKCKVNFDLKFMTNNLNPSIILIIELKEDPDNKSHTYHSACRFLLE